MGKEQLDYQSSEGCIATGLHREVIACGSAITLNASQSGALVLLDTATGSFVTLPTPAAGLQYEFAVTVSVTSDFHRIYCGSLSESLSGGLQQFIDDSAVTRGQSLNGTTHNGLRHDGATEGGLIGTSYWFVGISATVWHVTGLCASSGTLATPVV